MNLSSKAKTLLKRTYATGRPLATFDKKTEDELIESGLMKYDQAPLMVLTEAGESFVDWESEGNG